MANVGKKHTVEEYIFFWGEDIAGTLSQRGLVSLKLTTSLHLKVEAWKTIELAASLREGTHHCPSAQWWPEEHHTALPGGSDLWW